MSKKEFSANIAVEVDTSNLDEIYEGLKSIGILPEGYLKHHSKEEIYNQSKYNENTVFEIFIDTEINESYFMVWSNRDLSGFIDHDIVKAEDILEELSILGE